MKSGLLSIALALAAFAQTAPETKTPTAEKRGVTSADYFAFQNIGDAHISPDGKQVAYVLTTVDQKHNRRDNSIWAVGIDGKSAPRRLTAEGANSSSPRWSPDGSRLAFISTRGAPAAGETEAPRPQIYILHLDGGEAQAVTHLKNGAGVFQWSPDGKRFVVLSRSGPSDAVTPAARKSDVRHYSHISYKFNDTGWYDDKRSHLWVVDTATGEGKQITSGADWNDTDPQWSPDGTRIAFVSDRTGKEYDDGRNKDIWVIPAEGGTLAKISDHEFDDTQPRWSPDGNLIAFAGQTQRRQFPKLYIAPAAGGGKSSLVADDLDLIPADLHWGPGSHELRFEAGVKGEMHIFRVDLDTRKVLPVTSGERAVRGFDANKQAGVMTYTANDFQHLDDLYVAALDGSGERQLTHLNRALWAGLEVAGVERVPYKSTDGWDIDGFFVKPVGWQAGKKYPMVLSIHGGPAGQYGVDWYHEFQVYAGKGWAVFFCNPRGSTGYGQKFERGIVNNWGGMDYQDVMAGVDAALKKYPWVDTDRLGVTGGSYGGFMTNWILGHTTRFKAAVTLRSVANFISDDGTRDGAYGHEEDFKGFLFDEFDQYWNSSPLKYAKNVKTPTLILHSDNDYRVPLEQGEQWFRALKHYGVTSEFVIFPRENHNLTRTGEPKHLVESLDWQCYWFDKFLNGNEIARPPDQ
jgi:dipeptidyl aminopeptidase/acylaminoacyl peptidase